MTHREQAKDCTYTARRELGRRPTNIPFGPARRQADPVGTRTAAERGLYISSGLSSDGPAFHELLFTNPARAPVCLCLLFFSGIGSHPILQSPPYPAVREGTYQHTRIMRRQRTRILPPRSPLRPLPRSRTRRTRLQRLRLRQGDSRDIATARYGYGIVSRNSGLHERLHPAPDDRLFRG